VISQALRPREETFPGPVFLSLPPPRLGESFNRNGKNKKNNLFILKQKQTFAQL
jgi:hypothetical protein